MRILYDAQPESPSLHGRAGDNGGIGMFQTQTMAEEHKAHYRKFVTEAWPLLEPV